VHQVVRLLIPWLFILPGLAGAEEEPPCRPALPSQLLLVDLDLPPRADVKQPERRLFRARVTNRSGRLVCRVAATVTANGRSRAAACFPEDVLAVGADGWMLCTLMEAGDGQPTARARGTRRGRGQDSTAARRPRLAVTGLELVGVDALQAWQARRTAPRSQPASAPTAPRFGFRHVVKVARASDAKGAQQALERAMTRLRECLLGRARRNPKLAVQATLRLGVSRSRGENGETESLLAAKVASPPPIAPEMRDCVSALDLVTVPPGMDFLATAEVGYVGDGKPPPERAEPEARPVGPTSPPQRPGGKRGRSGLSPRMGR
jgi:hypothetical protein